jgi:hypothetical protein
VAIELQLAEITVVVLMLLLILECPLRRGPRSDDRLTGEDSRHALARQFGAGPEMKAAPF